MVRPKRHSNLELYFSFRFSLNQCALSRLDGDWSCFFLDDFQSGYGVSHIGSTHADYYLANSFSRDPAITCRILPENLK